MRVVVQSFAAFAFGAVGAVLVNCSGGETNTATQVAQADAQSEAIVAAANGFLATLTDDERSKVLFASDDAVQRAKWSNLPVFQRGGLDWGHLSTDQRTALMKLLGAVLSPAGVQMVRDQMAADDVLASRPDEGPPGRPAGAGGSSQGMPPGGPPAGGGPGAGPLFGHDRYFVSFVGTPSATSPWMLQFGGHHLAINATVAGPNVTLAPSLTGGQPLKFTALDDKRQVYLTKPEIDAAHALIAALSPTQRSEAIRADSYRDLVAGPQQDDVTVPAEGISASKLDKEQKAKLIALIESRVGIMNADDLEPVMAEVRANIDKLTFGWWGPIELGKPAYWRVVGPGLVLEYSPQQLRNDDPMQHAHNMYRAPGNDYGKAWTQ